MDRMRLAPVALVTLLLVPTVAAWPWDSPLQVHVAPLRVGDVLSWTIERADGGDLDGTHLYVVRVEGASRAVDAFGVERDAEALRVDFHLDGALMRAETCHQLRGGAVAVRRDVHYGAEERRTPDYEIASSGAPVGMPRTFQVTQHPLVEFSESPCVLTNELGGRAFEQGASVRLGDILPSKFPADDEPGTVVSQPATAIEWRGRDALVLRFDIRPFTAQWAPAGEPTDDVVGEIEIVVADGLPGYAEARGRWTRWREDGSPFVATERHELSGIAAAHPEAPALSPYVGVRLPERSPTASFAPRARLAVDDDGLDLAFRFRDAWESVLADPRMPIAPFVAANADAFLQQAHYAVGARDPDLANVPAVGEWKLIVCSASACVGAASVKLAPVAPLPTQPTKNRVVDELPAPDAPPAGDSTEIASGADTAALASRLVAPANGWGRIGYWAGGKAGPYAAMAFSETGGKDPEKGDEQGRHTYVDLLRARSVGIDAELVDQEGGLAALVPVARPPDLETSGGARVSTLSSPVTTGLAVAGALTGLALLGALAKTFAPFFTRLVQDRLLENATRMDLFQRVRREPGVRRAELIALAGVGNGTARHHIDQLVRHHLLYKTETDGHVRYFAMGEVPPDVAMRESILRAGSHRRVYELYASRGTVSLREAARLLDLSAPSVYRAKRKLEKAGLLPAPHVALAPTRP